MEYSGAFHVYIHYQAPREQLIPIGTQVKITIQPLSLIISVRIV